MQNLFSGFKVDYWYKAIIVIATAMLGATLVAGKSGAAITSLGFLLVGFGEWVNHPKRQAILPYSVYRPSGILTIERRDPSFFGCGLDFCGAAVIAFGIYKLAV